MQSAKDAREARRRKILERGTDRLALITGERKFVPTPVEPPADSLDQGDNSARLVNGDASIESHDEPSIDVANINGSSVLLAHFQANPGVSSNTAELGDEKGSLALKSSDFSFADESSIDVANMNGSSVLLDRFPFNSGANSNTAELGDEKGSLALRSLDSSPSVCKKGDVKKFPASTLSSLFTKNKFSYAIDASESARVLCAVAIAVFLVIHSLLLSLNNPLSGVLGRFVPPWPFFLIIVTDITLVMATMLLTSEKAYPEDIIDPTSEETYSTSEAWNWANKIGNVLQTLVILRKVVSAVSMEFSIYLVVLVCGHSLGLYCS